jgi:isopentenyl phosphate kinase
MRNGACEEGKNIDVTDGIEIKVRVTLIFPFSENGRESYLIRFASAKN